MEDKLAEFADSLREKAEKFTKEQRERLEQELDDIKFLMDRGSIGFEDVLDQGEEILRRAETGEDAL
jgi:hypothetical protein